MKKIFAIVFFALFLMLTFVACSVQTSTCEHQYITDVTKQPTCIAEGERTRTCTLCGEISTAPISKRNHHYISEVTTTPTCKTTGIVTYTCSGCDDSYTKDIAKADHNYTSKVTTKPTCQAAGVKTYTCSGCGDSYKDTVAKTDHNYTSKVTTKATCKAAGTKTYTCTDCGSRYTETISATGHTWKAATCTKPKTCTSCKATEGSAKGHSYSNSTCVHCGQYNLTKLQEIKDSLDLAMDSLLSAKETATTGLGYADIGMDDSFLGLAQLSAESALIPLAFDFPSIKLSDGRYLNRIQSTLRSEIRHACNASSCRTFLDRLASAEKTLIAMQNEVKQLIAQQS